jgi:hypothetical protein
MIIRAGVCSTDAIGTKSALAPRNTMVGDERASPENLFEA